jgi:hypothetical protein
MRGERTFCPHPGQNFAEDGKSCPQFGHWENSEEEISDFIFSGHQPDSLILLMDRSVSDD